MSKSSENWSGEGVFERGWVGIREGVMNLLAVGRGWVSLRKRGGRLARRLKGLLGEGCLLREGCNVEMTYFSYVRAFAGLAFMTEMHQQPGDLASTR